MAFPGVLKIGSKGENVKRLQLALNINVDGDFGPGTAAAVKEFQKANNLVDDGVVGAKTWEALGIDASVNSPISITPKGIKPLDIKQQRANLIAKKQDIKVKEEASILDPQSLENSVTEDSKPKGLQKIGQLLVTTAKNLAQAFIPVALNLIKQLGVEQLQIELDKQRALHPEWSEEELQSQVKKLLCPTKAQLDLIILQRNGLTEKLNAAGAKLDGLSVTINFGASFAEILTTLVNILKYASFSLNQSQKFITPVPGALPSLITDLQTATDSITFAPDGTPNLPPLSINVAQVSPAVALVQSTIVKCVDLLDSIDQLILLCAPNATLTPISDSINNTYDNESLAELTDNGNTYKGFVLETETRPYTPRVNENRAVGKNSSGIVMVYTDWSFASDPQVLIDELKFIIDRDNLKAY